MISSSNFNVSTLILAEDTQAESDLASSLGKKFHLHILRKNRGWVAFCLDATTGHYHKADLKVGDHRTIQSLELANHRS